MLRYYWKCTQRHRVQGSNHDDSTQIYSVTVHHCVNRNTAEGIMRTKPSPATTGATHYAPAVDELREGGQGEAQRSDGVQRPLQQLQPRVNHHSAAVYSPCWLAVPPQTCFHPLQTAKCVSPLLAASGNAETQTLLWNK